MADAARQIARLSMRNEAGTNALQRACEAAYDAQSLLDLVDSSDLEHTDTAGRTSLHTAAAEGLVAVMQRILSNKPELIGARTKSGNTALHRAAAYGNKDAVMVLLRASGGAALVDAQNSEGATAISRAARWGHDEVVELLLRHRARLDIADSSGRKPVDWARSKNHDFCAALLLGQPRASVVTLPSSSSAPAVSAVLTTQAVPAPPPRPANGGSDVAAAAPLSPSQRRSLVPPVVATPVGGGVHGGAALGHLPSIHESSGGGAGDDDESGAAQYISEDDEDGSATQGTAGPHQAYGSEADDGNAPLPEDCYDLGTPLHVEGWMAKQGQIFKTWKNRWFVLDGRRMAYYQREGAPKPRGVIEMIEGTDVVIEEKYPKPFCFTISTPTKRYILQAADEDEMVEWIEAVMNNLECVAPGDSDAAALGGAGGLEAAGGEVDDD